MDDDEQFRQEREERIASYAKQTTLQKSATTFEIESAKASYSYNFNWLGMPIFQYPQDLIALQEIIWRTRPKLIIETGIARGGSLVFYASMLELLGNGGRVVGIDIDLRPHNERRISAHPMAKRIELIKGSSLSLTTVDQVKTLVASAQSVMLVLDSNHTQDHVLTELQLYSPLVTVNNYCVVFDTLIERMPKGFYRDRPWDQGDNPQTAITKFLSAQGNFEVDHRIDHKLLFGAAQGGYLRRIA